MFSLHNRRTVSGDDARSQLCDYSVGFLDFLCVCRIAEILAAIVTVPIFDITSLSSGGCLRLVMDKGVTQRREESWQPSRVQASYASQPASVQVGALAGYCAMAWLFGSIPLYGSRKVSVDVYRQKGQDLQYTARETQVASDLRNSGMGFSTIIWPATLVLSSLQWMQNFQCPLASYAQELLKL